MIRLAPLIALALLAVPAAARPISTDQTDRILDRLARDAKGDTLALIVHGVPGHEATARAFQKRFPGIDVQVTVQNPSSMGPRIVTEQKNGIYAWDSWWAGTTAMNNVVLPAGGFEKITDYLVLPDVIATDDWHTVAYRYTSPLGPYIFVQSASIETGILFNSAVIKGLSVRTEGDLLDPRLKGRIAVRDPGGTNNGTYLLASLLRHQGEGFIRRLLLDQDPAIIENGRQVTDGVLRGNYAVVLGGSSDILSHCHALGGCRSVRALPIGLSILSRGVAVLKHAPHPRAARLWVNWLLSREGGEVFVREWAKDQSTGAFTMRTDVVPDPRHLASIPDYARFGQYGLYGYEAGRSDLEAANRLFDRLRPQLRAPTPPSAVVVLIVAGCGLLLLAGRTIRARLRRSGAAARARIAYREGGMNVAR